MDNALTLCEENCGRINTNLLASLQSDVDSESLEWTLTLPSSHEVKRLQLSTSSHAPQMPSLLLSIALMVYPETSNEEVSIVRLKSKVLQRPFMKTTSNSASAQLST